MSRPERDATPAALVAAEIGLLCAGLGTAIACSRLFIGWGFLGRLALAVVVSWVLATLTRRARLGVGWSAAVSAVVAVLVLTWVFVPGTATAGLPTSGSLHTVLDEMRASFSDFSSLIAPVEPTDGFLVVLAAVLWAFTWFADTAAFRYRGAVQAVIPYVSAFIAVGVLARDAGRSGAAVAFLGGLGIYAVTQRALVISERRWIRGESVRGTTSVASTAAAAVVVAIAVGLLVGPLLPGDTQAVVDLRSLGREGGARTVVSPFVGVRNLLGQQSDQVVFTVQSDVPSYWRLTSLARYDTSRDIWVSKGTYQEVDGSELESSEPPSGSTIPADQSFTIDALGGPWLPAAFVPGSIDIDEDVSFDPATSSIISRGNDLGTGTEYRVSSTVPRITTEDLEASHAPDRLDPGYLDASGASTEVRRTARRVTQGASTPFQIATQLQNWFRDNFRYDTDVDYRDDADPVAAFLLRKEGFCQQFASSFALMARALGLPARVAVGFTQGDAVVGDDGTTSFVVRGRHAHTWPEVHFDGVGWVAFEPTTGRGNPQAVDYTGIQPEQAAAPAAQAPTTTSPTTTTTAIDAGGAATTVPTGQVDSVAPDEADRTGDDGGTPWLPIAVGVAVLLAAGVAVVVLGRRRRHLSAVRNDPARGRVAAAWEQALADLSTVGIRPERAETPLEVAARVGSSDLFRPDDASDDATVDAGPEPADVGPALTELAHLETARRYARRDDDRPDDDDSAAAAEAAAATVRTVTRSIATRRQRARLLVSSPHS